jgi:signal transduction histidine kinase
LVGPEGLWPAVILLAITYAWPSRECRAAVETSHVLILNSYHPGFPWTDGEMAGIIDMFRAVDPGAQPFVEYMDCKHFPEAEHGDKLAEFYVRKYHGKRPSAVIATDNPALEFVVQHRNDVFPSIPIIFCGVNGFKEDMLAGHKDITGVAELLDAAATIDLALRLHPQTKEIVALHDYTVTGRTTRQELETVMPRFADKVRFRFIENLPIDDILSQLKALPGDRLLLILSFNTDSKGEVFAHAALTELVSRHCPVPIYAVHSLRLGYGIVGGSLLDARLHGARAAQIALRILAGEDASGIPVDTSSTSRLMLDYNQLKRFNIAVSTLPPGAIVINRPESVYHKYKNVILSVAAVIGGLITIVCLLLLYILARRKAEQSRRQLIEELENKNAELQRFIYMVSHDLRSPLVTIMGFLGMLAQDSANGRTEAVQSDIDFISESAQKMDALLHELLEFSRIGRTGNPVTDVHLAEVAREAASLSAGRIAERKAEVVVAADMPTVRADRTRLREVFQNLIDNAVKYMGDQPDPRVQIGVRRDGSEEVCYVRDNGIGMDPRYTEQVFGLFEKLDSQAEGSGVGLAIVKRVVELHGGRVWIETDGPGTGCTVCFTLAGNPISAAGKSESLPPRRTSSSPS